MTWDTRTGGGSATRSQQSQEAAVLNYADLAGGQLLNVRAAPYGAACDGFTDDTTAIMNALTAAAANGASVLIPGISVVQPLIIPPQVVVRGLNGGSYLKASSKPISGLKLKAGSTGALLSPDDTGSQPATGVQVLDLVLDTNNIAQPAINIPDAVSSIPRFWLTERCLVQNSGFSAAAHGSAVYIGALNTGCAIRDTNVLSNAAGITTRASHGWDGVGWYGSDGLMENCFIGCFADAGFQVYGGSADATLQVVGGGTFWNTYGLLIGGQGSTFTGMSIDHNYNHGAYCAFSTALFGCTFHQNGLQTNNTYNHIHVPNPVTVTVTGCRLAPQGSDAGANLCQYFINAVSGASIVESGNYQDAGATIGTAWRNPTNTTYAGNAGFGPQWIVGTGTPLGVVAAPVSSLFTRLDGGASTTLYVKESGGSTTSGWVAK